ncbi:hypothetical protein SCBWM1_gp52 [Synechococcus phage S-CBWM1]|uniref:Uncharacterized protein n=1 Tax=Synechococcus phage S-CBWM1 TaxID=2053653 RepID=A0A3G1L3I1_9CAUD|nr:hypothetical protein HOU61_gp145 [Synechococcus phage S-CBWM1]ATW62736.1 hypothetical protein SCBWM1_gp52 [Synechococcus phage S-CBWM1]
MTTTNSRVINREVTVGVIPTIDELAAMIVHLNSDDQAKLISAMAEHATFSVPIQLQYVTDCSLLTKEGRALMQLIGDYSYPTGGQDV